MVSCSHWGMFFATVNSGAASTYKHIYGGRSSGMAANAMYQCLNFGEIS